uniref:Protein VAC14 homolog n=1 Tax=Schistocephalus solidus TaxID=70667 RepID=A0A0X3NU79_SCHSO
MMNEKEFKLLPPGCVKNLSDKLFEKRKAGAMEVEQIVKALLSKEKFSDLEKILEFFGQEFIPSCNCHVRKGGLIGLASVAIGLGRKAANYSDMIITPVLQTFRDTDARVRYFACEALYNIMKVLQTAALRYLNEIFEALSLATADPDASVRQVAAHCDRLLRDIVMQSNTIDLNLFIPLFCERIYTSIPFTRQFLVCWLTTLNSMPTLSLLNYLPSLLDGLLRILSDSNSEIRRNCELLLSDFLMEISRQPESTDVPAMVNTLIVNCRLATAAVATTLQRGGCPTAPESLGANAYPSQSLLSASPERLQQVTALRWLNAFVDTESLNLLPLVADILSATLPCLIDDRSDCCLQTRQIPQLLASWMFRPSSA